MEYYKDLCLELYYLNSGIVHSTSGKHVFVTRDLYISKEKAPHMYRKIGFDILVILLVLIYVNSKESGVKF